MAYSKVSLISGLVALLLISNGVSARLMDMFFSNILMDDIHEERKLNLEQKGTVANGNSQATATAPAQLSSEKSSFQALATAPAPAPAPYATGREDGRDVDDDDTPSTGEGSQMRGVENGDDDESDDDPDNSDGDVPLP